MENPTKNQVRVRGEGIGKGTSLVQDPRSICQRSSRPDRQWLRDKGMFS